MAKKKKSTVKKNNNKNIQNEIKLEKQEEKEEIIENKKEEKIKKSYVKDTFIYNLTFMTLIFFIIEIIFKGLSNFDLINYSSLRIFMRFVRIIKMSKLKKRLLIIIIFI